MSIFTHSEMMRIQNKKENPLQWANDGLYYHILHEVRMNKEAILTTLSAVGSAVIFRFKDVEWNMSKKQEKEILRNATDIDRWSFRVQKGVKETEIEDKCYKHYVELDDVKASVHSILRHTDFMTRLRLAFGDDFEVVETYRMADNSPRINFRDNRPSYMVLDATIEIKYKPKRKTTEQKVQEFYKGHYPSTDVLCGAILVNTPVVRHLVFEDN